MPLIKIKTILPFIAFASLVALLFFSLGRDPNHIDSPLLDQPAPDFSTPALLDPTVRVTNQSRLGEVWLLNVWASWCPACRAEHPRLQQLQQQNLIDLVGLNYKDEARDARRWLADYGNPYTQIAVDPMGQIGIEYGVYGVPETFLIDKNGLIRFKHTGEITTRGLNNRLIPLIKYWQDQEP